MRWAEELCYDKNTLSTCTGFALTVAQHYENSSGYTTVEEGKWSVGKIN